MASILDQYGIREVADVTLYDSTGKPVLFLDTLKVSTLEQTASQSEAKGGKGNAPFIIWDFGKEITVSLEDALFTPKSMALMFGDSSAPALSFTSTAVSTMRRETIATTVAAAPTAGNTLYYAAADMSPITTGAIAAGTKVFILETKTVSAHTVTINADTFPGVYKLVGETYARNRDTGVDEFFQFVIPQAKMSPENTIALTAEGEPTVFNIKLRVLRPSTGNMMQLIKYSI